jgi:hypothetical protein
MTLIIASIRPHDLVLTSDGRSTTMANGKVDRIDDHYQKLFPIPDHPVVIAHMGVNDIGGEPVRKFLGKFIAQVNVGNFTISELADELRQHSHAAIRARLKEKDLRNLHWGVNLWVAGFSFHEEAPSMIELFWKYSDDVLRTEERTFSPTYVVPGGDGKDQIAAVDWHNVAGKSVEEVRAYHHTLMKQAIDAKVDPNSVGGRVHELVITPAKWRWTQPPTAAAETQPGTRE